MKISRFDKGLLVGGAWGIGFGFTLMSNSMPGLVVMFVALLLGIRWKLED